MDNGKHRRIWSIREAIRIKKKRPSGAELKYIGGSWGILVSVAYVVFDDLDVGIMTIHFIFKQMPTFYYLSQKALYSNHIKS